ncbi:MAG: PEP-CTERM sorting domain-containing protein, partial [Planctomycetota bacterium]
WSLDWQRYDIGLGPHPECMVRGVSFDGVGSYLDDVRIVLNARQVKIDINPGDAANKVNLKSKASLSVAILGNSLLNVHDVDSSSLRLDGLTPMPEGKKKQIGRFDDVNHDSFPDLVVAFSSADLPFQPQTIVAELSGRLLDGTEFFGTDAIQMAVGRRRSVLPTAGPMAAMGDLGEIQVQSIPEPATLSLVALVGLAALRRRPSTRIRPRPTRIRQAG